MSSIYRTLTGGLRRDITLTCLAVWFIGLSYGAIAVASGLPLWVPAPLSVLVLAGASEILFVGIVATGGNPIAAALAGCWSTPATCRTARPCPTSPGRAGGGCSAPT